MSEISFNQARADAFSERMVSIMNHAAIALMTGIGHQVGLFDTMVESPSATSHQIAEAAGLNERYVREWLGAMVTGLVIDYNLVENTYTLPPEHAAYLTRAAGVNNWAPTAQIISLLAQVEEPLIECFRKGGGVPYSAYPRFQQVMAENSALIHDVALIRTILPIVDGLTERLQVGIEVADIGCGSGHALNLMAQAFPRSHFIGYDFSEEGILVGQSEAQALGLTNTHFEVQDIARLNQPNRFDLITAFDAIHDQAHPARVLRDIAAALRPDGIFLMAEWGASSNLHENLDFLLGPFMYTISCMHCMTVSLALDGAGLGAMWGEQTARQMLKEAGFTNVETKRIDDSFNNYYVCTIS